MFGRSALLLAGELLWSAVGCWILVAVIDPPLPCFWNLCSHLSPKERRASFVFVCLFVCLFVFCLFVCLFFFVLGVLP